MDIIIIMAVTFHCPSQQVTDAIRAALTNWQAEGPDADYPATFCGMPDELGRYQLTATFMRRVDRFDWRLRQDAIRASIIETAGQACQPEDWYDEQTWWVWQDTYKVADGRITREE